MSHLVSAPALRCARTIMKSYSLEVRPPENLKSGRLDGLTNSERHVSTLIDHATNVYRVSALRPELHYWQRMLTAETATAAQIASFLGKVLTELHSVPKSTKEEEQEIITFAMPTGFATKGLKPERRPLSKFAVEASRVLFYYYELKSKTESTFDEMKYRIDVAQIVDAVLGLSRVLKLENILMAKKKELTAGHLTKEDVRILMRSTGVCFNKMPTFADRREEALLLS